ncbi:MAG: hypothetical protein WCW26_01195 [Candidatus Buchananbacteria bacterium]
MDKKQIESEKNLMISQIKKYSPIFKRFFDINLTLRQYSKGIYDFKLNKVYIKRQEIVKKEILLKFNTLFGKDCQKKLNINFTEQLAINIVDHHQVLNHPLLISDNVIANVGKFNCKKRQDAIVVISSGDVPPNNYFSKNGFQFHEKKVPIFSNSESESNSCLLPKRDFNFIEKLKISKKWSNFTPEEKNFLFEQYKKISSLDFSGCANYNDQITVIVNDSWHYLFEDKLRKNLPELLYITQEELTTNCLLKILDDKNYITEILFNKQFRNKVLDNFRGIVVTWNEKENKGTHFFWRKHPFENRLLRMYVRDEELVPCDKEFENLKVNFEKEEIRDLLIKKEIFPSLFMIFGVLNFYFGIKPLVGQGSIIYLNLIRDGWINLLKESEFKDEVKNIQSYEIDYMISGLALFFQKAAGQFKTLYAYDIIYNGGVSAKYLDKAFEMKFGDLLAMSITGTYDYISQKYIPDNEKIKPKVTADILAESLIDWL